MRSLAATNVPSRALGGLLALLAFLAIFQSGWATETVTRGTVEIDSALSDPGASAPAKAPETAATKLALGPITPGISPRQSRSGAGQPLIRVQVAEVLVRIENPTQQAVQVHQIPPDGSDAPVIGQVDAGFMAELPTSPGTTLGFSDGQNWIGGNYQVTDGVDQIVTLPYAGAVATAGAASPEAGGGPAGAGNALVVRIENPSGQPLQIHELPADGSDAPVIGQVEAGFAVDLPASPGIRLGFSDGQNWIGENYTVTADAGQVVSLPFADAGGAQAGGPTTSPAAPPAGTTALTVRIENPTQLPLQIHEVPADGSAPPVIAQVDPGFAIDLPASPGLILALSDGQNWVGDPYTVTADAGQVFQATQSGQPGQTGPPSAGTPEPAEIAAIGDGSVILRIENPSAQELSVHEILADGSDAPEVARVSAGFAIDLPAQANALVGFSDGPGWVGGIYEVTGEPSQTVSLPLPAQPSILTVGDGSMPVLIRNPTGQPLLVHHLLSGQQDAPVVATVDGGFEIQLPAMAGETIGFSDGNDWAGDPYLVTAEAGQAVILPFSGATAAAGPGQIGNGSVIVGIQNPTGEPLDIHQVFGENDPTQYITTVGAGFRLDLPAESGALIGFANAAGWVGGFYDVTPEGGQELVLPLSDAEPVTVSQIGNGSVTVKITNSIASTIQIQHIPGGDQQSVIVASVAPGETVDLPAEPGASLGFVAEGRDGWFGFFDVQSAAIQPIPIPAPMFAGRADAAIPLQNPTGRPFEIAALINDQWKTLGIAPEGHQVWLAAEAGMRIAVLDGDDFVGGYITVPSQSTAPVILPAPIAVGAANASVRLTNSTRTALTIMAVRDGDPNGDLALGTIGPGATIDMRAQPGIKLGFSDDSGYVGGTYTVVNAASQGIRLPQPIRVGDASSGVVLINTGGTLLNVNHIVSKSQVEPLGMIRPGETLELQTSPCTMLGFADANTGQWAGGMFQTPRSGQPQITVPRPEDSDTGKCAVLTQAQLDEVLVKIAIEQAKAAQEAKSKTRFCWKESYGRGVGRVPRNCNNGREEATAGLCYDRCTPRYDRGLGKTIPFKSGFIGNSGLACIAAVCPPGYTNHGHFCKKPGPTKRREYPVNFKEAVKTFGSWIGIGSKGDTGLAGAMKRCQAESRLLALHTGRPPTACVKANRDTIVYSKCPAGTKQAPVITNLCTPICPSGWTDIGISCTKPRYSRHIGLMDCDRGADRDAGLCYKQCNRGFTGVGPVCWNSCPASVPVNCGMACAASKDECALTVTDQVTGPIMTAASVALIAVTAGGATGATTALNTGKAAATTAARTGGKLATKSASKVAARAALKQSVINALKRGASKAVAKAVITDLSIDAAFSGTIAGAIYGGMSIAQKNAVRKQIREAYDARYSSGEQIDDKVIESAVNAAIEGADKSNPAADFPWESLDPTGVAEIVKAYNHPVCTDVR